MPNFRVYRMKETARQNFRWAPHVSGAATVKPKDFEAGSEVEAPNEYAAWAALRGSERPLQVGDVLQADSGDLRICKYVGFEAAQWLVVEAAAPPASVPVPQSA